MSKRPCAFCPKPATTGEHIWSNWVNALLGGKRKYIIREHIENREWQTVGLHQKLPVLCDSCNNVWGSEIETRMKTVSSSMVKTGDRTILNANDIVTISIYAQLKAFVSDYSQKHMASFYEIRERHAFRYDFTFPSGTNIWLAHTFDDHGVFKGSYAKPPLNTPKRFHTHIFTMSLGQLLIQLTSVRWTKKSNRKFASPPLLTQHFFWDKFSTPIWPHVFAPVSWPPSQQLGRDALDAIFNRWKTLNRTD